MSLFKTSERAVRPVPPIDLEEPRNLRTATFALG
jgi:hypothetical protein